MSVVPGIAKSASFAETSRRQFEPFHCPPTIERTLRAMQTVPERLDTIPNNISPRIGEMRSTLKLEERPWRNRNPCGFPFSMPCPTIWPHALMSVAERSRHFELPRIRVFKSLIPVRSDQMNGWPDTP